MQNLITRKIKYTTSNENLQIILKIQKQYNNVLHYIYNRLFENNKFTTKQSIDLINKNLNNITIDTYFKNGALYEAKNLINKNNKKQIIFGGLNLFLKRCKNLITKQEFQIKKLFPLQIIGAKFNKGNCKFQIIDETKILFKPNKNIHIILNLTKQSKKSIKELLKLKELQNNCIIPITYKLNKDYVYLTFDYNYLFEKQNYQFINNRIFAIDMNPNYIGYSVIDWKDSQKFNLIDKGIISLKPLNDKDFNLKNKGYSSNSKLRLYLNNKRKYEIIKIAQNLIKLAKHYKCQIFSIEDLNIKNSDKELGKKFNKLINNLWCRNIFENQINKYCNFIGIKLIKVLPNYSSFIGNLVYRELKLPDMILSSIEISRRSYEFYHQYIKKDKLQEKNIVWPKLELVKNKIIQSLEELNCFIQFKTLKELYYVMKKSKQKYRFLLDNVDKSRVFSIFYKKQYKILYNIL